MLKTAVAGVILSFSSFANAVLILEGGTNENSAGNILLQGNNSVTAVSFNALSSEITTPNSYWVWDDKNSSNVTFTFSFSLDGYDASTAKLAGFWGVKNSGTVLLNEQEIDASSGGNFSHLDELPLETDNFIDGKNVLTFNLSKSGAQAAFRASVQVTADRNQVPEPTTLALLALGIIGLVARRSLLMNKKQ